jgi:hypothetical protein
MFELLVRDIETARLVTSTGFSNGVSYPELWKSALTPLGSRFPAFIGEPQSDFPEGA